MGSVDSLIMSLSESPLAVKEVSPFEGGAGGWLGRFVILIKLRIKGLQHHLGHPPESTMLILPISKGEIFPQQLNN